MGRKQVRISDDPTHSIGEIREAKVRVIVLGNLISIRIFVIAKYLCRLPRACAAECVPDSGAVCYPVSIGTNMRGGVHERTHLICSSVRCEVVMSASFMRSTVGRDGPD